MPFSSEWLALREPADLAARDKDLLDQAARLAGEDAIVLDLGSGTGSTARAFASQPSGRWTWRFVDGDAGLLEIALRRHPGSEGRVMNLSDVDDLPLENVTLVTASALLDLMPSDWMTGLAARLRDAAIPFYAALNYDGHMSWSPPLDRDREITDAFNTHQGTDKGIGAAMGPRSGAMAADILTAHGFKTTLRRSPWILGTDQCDLHHQLITGIGEAAEQTGEAQAADWVKVRQANIGGVTGTIGHTDLLAIPDPQQRSEIFGKAGEQSAAAERNP